MDLTTLNSLTKTFLNQGRGRSVSKRAAAVNPVDWKIMAGGLSDVLPVLFPATIGWDVAGVVDAVGYGVQEFAVGDEILADNMQDFVSRGSMAEYTIVPVRVAAKKPQALSFVEAASLPLAGQTALQGVDHLGLSKGTPSSSTTRQVG